MKINDLIKTGKAKRGRPLKGRKCPNSSIARKKQWADLEYRARMSEKHKGQHSSVATEFKKGGTAPNKGKKLPSITGEKHWNWQGGKTALKLKIRNLIEYKEWRVRVFARDGGICQICGDKDRSSNAHHAESFSHIFKYEKIKTLEDALRCKKLWDIRNGITLCKECHRIFKSRVLWITGQSQSGKTTLALYLQRFLRHSIRLDGDDMRHVFEGTIGFSREDRWAHNLRIARLAKVFVRQGKFVLVSLICPYEKLRQEVKKITNCKFIYMPGGIQHKDYPYEIPKKPDLIMMRGE